jgi:hypothetical protein
MNVTNLAPKSSAVATNELRDIKPPVEIPSGWAWVWWVVAAIAFVLLAWWAWRYWRRKKSIVPVVPIVPPHIRARQKLEQALALLGQPREFCILVSDAIRWYLEERFQFRAPERTTEEFLHELQATQLLSTSQKSSLGDFLARCDLVKFARYEPGEAELRDLLASALRLIEETKPKPEPSVVTGSGPPPEKTTPEKPVPERVTAL